MIEVLKSSSSMVQMSSIQAKQEDKHHEHL